MSHINLNSQQDLFSGRVPLIKEIICYITKKHVFWKRSKVSQNWCRHPKRNKKHSSSEKWNYTKNKLISSALFTYIILSKECHGHTFKNHTLYGVLIQGVHSFEGGCSFTGIDDMFSGYSFGFFARADKSKGLARLETFDICHLDYVFVVLKQFLNFVPNVIENHDTKGAQIRMGQHA